MWSAQPFRTCWSRGSAARDRLGTTIRAHFGHWGELLGQHPEQNAEPQEGQVFSGMPGL
jgi:hypothetical protein